MEGGLEPEVGMRENETLEPDARLVWREEEGELESGEITGAGPLPPLLETVTASGNYFPYTLRQTYVGDMVEGGLPGWGPEVAWVDRGGPGLWAQSSFVPPVSWREGFGGLEICKRDLKR